MKIVLFGANGFLGKALAKHFINSGAEVHIVARKKFDHIKNAQIWLWDGQNLSEWTNSLEHADVVINMAGKSVDCRYTAKNKNEIYDSRIKSTQIIGEAIAACPYPPKMWLNSSSATIYRYALDKPQDEPNGELGDDFSPDVCKKWEATLFRASTPKTIKYALRTSIVLGNDGGALPMLEKITKIGLGGKQGNGKQMVSWIHIDDFVNAVQYIITQKLPEGYYNVCSPNPVTNQIFMKTIRKKCKISFGIGTPKWLLEVGAFIIGTETELLLKSRWVLPYKLLNGGFVFQKGNINDI